MNSAGPQSGPAVGSTVSRGSGSAQGCIASGLQLALGLSLVSNHYLTTTQGAEEVKTPLAGLGARGLGWNPSQAQCAAVAQVPAQPPS